jgi:hypothetical protein
MGKIMSIDEQLFEEKREPWFEKRGKSKLKKHKLGAELDSIASIY